MNNTQMSPWLQNAINDGLIDGGFLPPNPDQGFSSMAQSSPGGLAVNPVELPQNFENAYSRKAPEIPFPPSDPSFTMAAQNASDPSYTQGGGSLQPFSMAQNSMPPAPVQTAQNMPNQMVTQPVSHQAARTAVQGLGYTPKANAQATSGFAMNPPKPQANPTVYSGAPIQKDAQGKFHYKSFDDFLKYLSVPEEYRPKPVSGDGSDYIPKFGKKEGE